MKKILKPLSWIGFWLILINWNSMWYCNWNYPTTYIWNSISVNSKTIIAQAWTWSTDCCALRAWNSKSYNLKKDLWLPIFKWVFNSVKNWIYHRWSLKWFWSLFKSNNITYNLYTTNGEKWGICKPYWIVGLCWYQSGCFEKNAKPTHLWNLWCRNPWWWADNAWMIFWIPYAYIDWQITNKLNITTSNWHLNWALNENDVEFNFSFY